LNRTTDYRVAVDEVAAADETSSPAQNIPATALADLIVDQTGVVVGLVKKVTTATVAGEDRAARPC
jgi:hypothetical protein